MTIKDWSQTKLFPFHPAYPDANRKSMRADYYSFGF